MAIFYEHIKGCGPKSIYTSWIKWSDENSTPGSSKIAKYLPKIEVGNYDFGKIITSDASEQVINKYFTFNQGINVGDIYMREGQSSNISYDREKYILTIDAADDSAQTYGTLRNYFKLFQMYASGINIWEVEKSTTKIKNELSVLKSANIQKVLYVGKDSTLVENYTDLDPGTIKADEKCEAKYFNATSDARAKSNITPAQFSALDVIKQLPIYTFNYLNDPKLSVGLIAQEAAEHDLDGFNMVDNLDAEGAFGDFMQIKESKRVYVLWKAVQELTDEINSLKDQIQQLENK